MTAAAFTLAGRAHADAAQGEENRVDFNIPAQSVPAALSEFARQARVQLFFISDGFEDVQANAVVGAYAAQRALDMLLDGTGLTASVSAESGVKVRRASASTNSLPSGGKWFMTAGEGRVGDYSDERRDVSGRTTEGTADSADPTSDRTERPLEEIVITGSSIRGIIPESSPLTIYDYADIRSTGALTVEQFVSTLTQNNNTLSEIGSGTSSRETNSNASSSVDLRGLGVGTTLVLLNGRRMAPSSSGRTADLSFIPLEAVERVEVLTDGASAIYGADAIGGVVNFVLKDQQDGAETVVSYGGARGGSETLRIDQSFGFNWLSGNALVALSFMDRNELDAAERDYAQAAAPQSLVPGDTRRNVLVTASNSLPGEVTISGDLLYSTRKPRTVRSQSLAQRVIDGSIDHEQALLNLELARHVGKDHNAALLLTYADASADHQGIRTDWETGFLGTTFRTEDSQTVDVTAKLDGKLASIPSGKVMYALGAGYTEDEFGRSADATGVGGDTTTTQLDRSTRYAFAELLLPVVSGRQDVKGIQRLELVLATRYTRYSDFGDNTSSKVGVLWSPAAPLVIRGTFGESFKAPFLSQLDPSSSSYVLFSPVDFGWPDIWTPDDAAIVLFGQGPGNPTLGPEEATTYTFGFDLDISNLVVTATYFKIEYTDRIAEPDPTGGFLALENPHGFPDLFELNPTLDQVTQLLTASTPFNFTGIDTNDPNAVHAATTVLFDNRIQNLSITEMNGLDLSVGYSTDAAIGKLSFGLSASKIFAFDEWATRSATATSRVNTVLFPSDLKVRGSFGLQGGNWSANMNVSYVDEYYNPFDPDNPEIDDWTTFDLLLAYTIPQAGHGLLNGVRAGLAMQNVFDKDPPFVTVGTTTNASLLEPVGFDPANANPVGRFITFQVSKSW